MSVIGSSILAGASGSAGGDKVYVDDVFSTFLYEGAGSSLSVNTGIDNTEKSLFWAKARDKNEIHGLLNTEDIDGSNGPRMQYSNLTSAGGGIGAGFAFTSSGVTIPNNGTINENNEDYVSWNFKAAPGFFDVVTYAGNGTAGRTVAHNLGSVPGMIIVKSTSQARQWSCFHRGLGNTKFLILNSTSSQLTSAHYWNNTSPTSSVFTLGADADVNQSGTNYVAYVFAHDDASFGTDEDESIIKCGTYTGNGGTQEINLGFEAQWIMVKSAGDAPWIIQDMMRSGDISNVSDNSLSPDSSGAETGSFPNLGVTATGFQLTSGSSYINGNSVTYIYMAIRRPNKPLDAFDPPLDATEVFAIDTWGGTSPNPPAFNAGFPIDLAFYKNSTSSTNWELSSRLAGGKVLNTNSTAAQSSDSEFKFDYQEGVHDSSSTFSTVYGYLFKRAPGFMDVVAYSGNSVAGRAVAHNLGVVPELMLVKRRNQGAGQGWNVYAAPLGNTSFITLNTDQSAFTGQAVWNSTTPTSSGFYLNNDAEVNSSSYTYIALLFATLPGVSKVGSYSGTGNAINVNCGFAAGARFILIKRTNATGDWHLWDSVRGIVSGNDPYFFLNSNAAQVTNTDYIDPNVYGFTVTSSAPAALNTSGGTYLFLAIA